MSLDRIAREQYLAEPHVGVLSVAVSGPDAGATIAVPIWYDFSPEAGVSVITSRTSLKGAAIEAAGRFGLVAQTEEMPYRYVSVEGPVVEVRPCELERDLLPMAVRYFGRELGQRYADGWAAGGGDDHVFVMRPEHWRTADLSAAFAELGIGTA
jgi:uncharacterized protein